jgi:hypothetical protein
MKQLVIFSNTIEFGNRRYDRTLLSDASINRLMRVVNALPSDRKTIEVERDLSLTLYVFYADKPALEEPICSCGVAMNSCATGSDLCSQPAFVQVQDCAVAVEPVTIVSGSISEAAARMVLGDRNYNVYLHHTSVGRLSVKLALAYDAGNTRRGDALKHVIQRKNQEGLL